jgi:Zn-dependent peptidase ImmA (M78 family)
LVSAKAGTIIIDVSLMNRRSDGRFRYTCGHELAHWVEHKEYFTSIGQTAAMTKIVRSSEADRIVERQADRLTSYLLMPKGTVKMAFYRNHRAKDVIAVMANIFHVSRQAMGIRLKEMGLLS